MLMASGLYAAPVRFAIIGDYGVDNADERAVAGLVLTNLQPELIVTVGDNNYLGGANIDRAVGKYYFSYIGNYAGSYGTGASSNRFFPALGNHDWEDSRGFAAHTDYFTLPGNERYYEFVRGPVHLIILNSDTHEPDGATASSMQAGWLSNRLAASVSPWRIIVAQDPPYSSTSPTARMRWPFREWGASLVVSGHAHHYERMSIEGLTYLVNGSGGASLAAFGPPIGGSLVRYNASHGAMLVAGTETNLVCEFWSIASGGTLIDRITLQSQVQLTIRRQAEMMQLSWPTNGADRLALEAAGILMPAAWQRVQQTPTVSGGSNVVTLTATNRQQFFRLKQ